MGLKSGLFKILIGVGLVLTLVTPGNGEETSLERPDVQGGHLEHFRRRISSLIPSKSRNKRHKRQLDFTTEVIGLIIDSEATEGEYQTLKSGVRNVTRRAVRQVQKMLEAEVGPRLLVTEERNSTSEKRHVKERLQEWFKRKYHKMSKITRLFHRFNFNYKLAQTLKRFVERRGTPILKRMVVLNPLGVSCNDVCVPEKSSTVGSESYGALGICTAKYCKCNFQKMAFKLHRCNSDQVFDGMSRECKYPHETILCSDADQ